MKSISNYFLVTLTVILFASCEDAIDPDLELAEPVVNIDAWLNDRPGDQIIYINQTIAYDDNETVPPGVTGAIVRVSGSDGTVYEFQEDFSRGEGAYVWSPALPSQRFGRIGESYGLTVIINGETYTASSRMGNVPEIDSITFEFEDDSPFFDEGYQAEFWAKDLVGAGNTYWIRTFKNGVLLNKPSEINLAFDAGLSEGSGNDGKTFLPPVRFAINPFDENEDGEGLPPYEIGDKVSVEIHSISREAFNYLNEVIDNTDRPTGIGSLFATPLSNVSTNIRSNNPGRSVVGFFNVAAVSSLGKTLE